MSSALQNRLVGTAIVVAIVVIFLPDLLDGKQESKRNLFVELPQKPTMKAVQSPAPFDVEKTQESATRKVEVISEQALDDNLDSNSAPDTKAQSRSEDIQIVDVPQQGSDVLAEGSQETVVEDIEKEVPGVQKRKFWGYRGRRVAHRKDFVTPATAEPGKEGEEEKSSSDTSSSSSDSHSSSSSSDEEKEKREAEAEVKEIIGPERPVPGTTEAGVDTDDEAIISDWTRGKSKTLKKAITKRTKKDTKGTVVPDVSSPGPTKALSESTSSSSINTLRKPFDSLGEKDKSDGAVAPDDSVPLPSAITGPPDSEEGGTKSDGTVVPEDEVPPPPKEKVKRDRKKLAKSTEHLLFHHEYNPWCDGCVRGKTRVAPHPVGSLARMITYFGQLVTCDVTYMLDAMKSPGVG